MAAQRISIVGSGNWGSTIAKIVGKNVQNNAKFELQVKMYVYEEMINGRKLTEIINQDHENVKYLPGHKLPENVVAIPDVVEATHDADIIIFVLPHQFMTNTCKPLIGKIKPNAVGVSLCKGFYVNEQGQVDLISNMVKNLLKIDCCVVMGANLANEVANENFCEATIGIKNVEKGAILKEALQTSYFRICVVPDAEVVESCGALKNIVAVGAGFCDGLSSGDNTKAAVIRLGLMEMIRFCELFYPNHQMKVFFESCGVADLVTTCYGGRNRKVAEAFARTNKTIEELEKEMLNGQRLQGPETAKEVNLLLKSKNMEDK
jgi:glycerol-3-phosphate dehydrogenase (NAD+)